MIPDIEFPEIEYRMKITRRVEDLRERIPGFRFLPARVRAAITRLSFRLEALREAHRGQ